jgi:hypothetical protein
VTDFFSTPDDLGEIRQSDLQSSLGDRLGAQAADALDPKDSLSGMWVARRLREAHAGGEDLAVGSAGDLDVYSWDSLQARQDAIDAQRAAIPDTAIDDAKARVKQEGLEGQLKLPDQPSIKSPVLDLMISEAHERRDRELAIAKGPQGFLPGALGLVTSLGAGMIDPVNMAAYSIPVLGEARAGKLLASAGDSILARTGARALEGGLQGAVGTAVLQPSDWWLHTQDGQDYTMADALKSVVMGAGMGAAFHAGFGAVGDARARWNGAPLAGSPQDQLLRGLPSDHPAAVLADLPPAAQEDLVRASIADITADRPVRGAEVLQIAADHDPRIAESLDGPGNARQAVADDIHRQLVAAGMGEDEAAANAAIVAARYATRADRLGGAGGTALDLYRGEGVDVRSGEEDAAAEGRSFAQSPTPPREHGFPESAGEILSSHGSVAPMKAHPDYVAAKAGDTGAALRLVEATVKPHTIDEARARFGPDAIFAPVMAEEASGRNAIPNTLANFYAHHAGGKVDNEVVQSNRAYHTGAGAMERLAVPVHFHGEVVKGGKYVLVDDVSVMGSTLAGMSDYIQRNGGEVAGVVTLVNTSRVGVLRPTKAHLADIERRYGHELRNTFGIEPGALTGAESAYVRNYRDADSLRAGHAAALRKRADRLAAKGIGGPEGEAGAGGVSPRSFDQSHPTAPTFYSAVGRAIDTAKQDKASPEQWLGTLKNAAGVKGEEMKWLGLEDWLKQQKGSVTKAQLLDYIRANQIEVKEVTKGGPSPDQHPALKALYDQNAMLIEKYGGLFDAFAKMSPEEHERYDVLTEAANRANDEAADEAARELYGKPYGKLRRFEQELVDRRMNGDSDANGTKYPTYRLAGGENYREMLLTLPAKPVVNPILQRMNVLRDQLMGPIWDAAVEREGSEDAAERALEHNANYNKWRHELMTLTREYEGGQRLDDQNYRSGHWDEPNILAHVRFDDRVSDGKKTLHVAEVQSDWHQAGKRKGYKTSEGELPDGYTLVERGGSWVVERGHELIAEQSSREVALADALQYLNRGDQLVPDAPFKTTWPELAMKRMIRYAAEHGYDRISWDTGATNAERYDLSKQISRITLHDNSSGGIGRPQMEGPFEGGTLYAYDHDGHEVLSKYIRDPGELPDVIGKEAADKIMSATPKEARSAGVGVRERKLEGLDLQVGGEGMHGFYDKILPATVGKLVKKFGAKVESGNVVIEKFGDGNAMAQELNRMLDEVGSATTQPKEHVATPVHAVDITPELRKAAVEQGFPLFQGGDAGNPRGRITLADNQAIIRLFAGRDPSTFMHESAHLWLDELMRDADHPEAPEALRGDRDAVLEWLGVRDASEIGVAEHEQWAEAFESYLADGQAPSSALARAFEQFKQWMMQIYRAISGAGREVSPEIKGVMDRLLATDKEIAERRGGGPAQRSSPAVAAADPRWRALADAPPAEDDPDVVAASKAADRLEEPASLVPERSLTELERQAADAEAIWRQMEPTLSEDERRLVNDVLDQVKLDKEARDQIITDGAACLVAAAA